MKTKNRRKPVKPIRICGLTIWQIIKGIYLVTAFYLLLVFAFACN